MPLRILRVSGAFEMHFSLKMEICWNQRGVLKIAFWNWILFIAGYRDVYNVQVPGFFIFTTRSWNYGSNKKGTYLKPFLVTRKIKMEYRRYVNPPESEEHNVCTISEKCKGCPFPSTGFICWGSDGECLRTRFEKLQRKEKNNEPNQWSDTETCSRV